MALSFAAAAAGFLWTAARASGRPLNLGADRRWAGLWLLLVFAVAVSHVLLGPRMMRRLWGPGIAAIALAMTVLSGQAAAVAIACWLLALAWALGAWLLDRIAPPPLEVGFERAAIATALGLTLLAFLALCLALAHILTPAASYGMLLLLTLLAGWPLLRRPDRESRRKTLKRPPPARRPGTLAERPAILILLGFIALANFAWALAPEIQYDAMNYQLSVPAVYAAEHRLVDLPVFWHSYFAHLVNMLFALGFSLSGQTVAKLLVFATGLLAAGATYALGRSLWNERIGLWAAAAFYATPLVGWLSSTAYVDLPVTLFSLASLLALFEWKASGRSAWLAAAGALAGAALGTKLTALSSVVALLAALAVLLYRDANTSPIQKAARLAVFLLPLGLVAAPWYGIVLAFTGNPVFPLFNGVFRSPGWAPINTRLNAGLFGIGTSPASLLELPFALTYRTGRFGETLPDGAVGLALALVPAAAVFAWKALAGRRVLLAMIACYLAVWAFNVQYARYYIPLLPVACAVAAAAVASLSNDRRFRVLSLSLAAIVLAAQVPLHLLQYWNIHERIPLRVAFGRETREAFLSRALGMYEAVQYVNGVARTGEKAVTGGADAMRFYLKVPLASMSETFDLKRICAARPPGQIARNLTENGYRYLLLEGADGSRRPDSFSTPEFLRRFTTLEFQHSSGRVYRIHAEPNPGAPAENLLSNPGFESLDGGGRPAVWIPNGDPAIVRGPEARSGGAALLCDPKNFASQPVAVDPLSRYLLRHWSREAVPGSSARLQVNWLNASGATMDSTIEVVPALPDWTEHEMLVIVPPGAATAAVFASVHRGKVVFDDFLFLPAEPLRE